MHSSALRALECIALGALRNLGTTDLRGLSVIDLAKLYHKKRILPNLHPIVDDNSWSNSYEIHFQIKLVPKHDIYTWYLVH